MSVLSDHAPQTWWDITYVYEGKQRWAVASGETVEEAQANFKSALPHPDLVVITEVKLVLECTGIEAMSAVCSRG